MMIYFDIDGVIADIHTPALRILDVLHSTYFNRSVGKYDWARTFGITPEEIQCIFNAIITSCCYKLVDERLVSCLATIADFEDEQYCFLTTRPEELDCFTRYWLRKNNLGTDIRHYNPDEQYYGGLYVGDDINMITKMKMRGCKTIAFLRPWNSECLSLSSICDVVVDDWGNLSKVLDEYILRKGVKEATE